MASSMLTAAASAAAAAVAAAAATQANVAPAASGELREDAFMDACKHDEDAVSSSLHTCANDPDYAVICSFLQKFATDLGLEVPNFKQLQEWITNTDDLSPRLRDLHIKLLRKTRKTVHEKSWESALSKFCFTYSAQDGWEVERFGYKKSSLKVKLRIFRELLESQFERNIKFRSKMLTLSADSLRTQPIGRDRLGHSYWLTQDEDCNLRIYQEHLDEEIWQVVATNRDEFVNLISRLRGNEVVLPSTDIGVVDEDTNSSNSCVATVEKPPPPEERDDSQEEEAKVPNLRIKLNNHNSKLGHVTNILRNGDEAPQTTTTTEDTTSRVKHDKLFNGKVKVIEERVAEGSAKADGKDKDKGDSEEDFEEPDEEDEEAEVQESDEHNEHKLETKRSSKNGVTGKVNRKKQEEDTQRKVKPLLISQAKITSPTNINASKKRQLEDVDRSSPTRDDVNMVKKARPSLLDSKREKKPSKYENTKSEDDEDDDDDDDEEMDDEEEEEDEDDDDDIDDECEEEDMDSVAAEEGENEKEFEDDDDEVGDAIEEPTIIVRGNGAGKDCDGGNPEAINAKENQFAFDYFQEWNESAVGEAIEDAVLYITGEGTGHDCLVGATKNEAESTSTTPTPAEPKATFFFGEPGCLKLSPMKHKSQEGSIDSKQSDEDELKNEDDEDDETTSDTATDEASAQKDTVENAKTEQDNGKHTNESDVCEDEAIADKNTKNTENYDKIVKANGDNTKGEEEPADTESSKKVAELESEKKSNEVEKVNDLKPHEADEKESENLTVEESRVNNKEEPADEVSTAVETPMNAEKKEEETVEETKNTNAEKSEENTEKCKTHEEEEATTAEAVVEAELEVVEKEKTENGNETVPNEEPTITAKEEPASESVEKPEPTAIVPQEITTEIPEELKEPPPDSIPEPTKLNSAEQNEEVPTSTSESPPTTTSEQISSKPTITTTTAAATTTTVATATTTTAATTTTTATAATTTTTATAATTTTTTATTTKTEVKNALTATTPSIPNRKRRLDDFASSTNLRQSTSESEIDHSENLEDPNPEEENSDEDVGGKRFKMRPKLTNTEIRKKVEAQKVAVEETTSSSGEEDARRRRKIISPKRQLDKNSLKSPKVVEKPQDVEIGAATAVVPAAAADVDKQKPIDKKLKISSTREVVAKVKEVNLLNITPPKSIPTTPTTSGVKQKPTLAEIIEKKLKKTPEKPVTSQPQDTTSPGGIKFSPPKKSPITKPLKKNLLTQIRQEESDDEAIPRKRAISETVAACVVESTKGAHEDLAQPELAAKQEEPLSLTIRDTVDRRTPERKTPERKTAEGHRKRRSSEEPKPAEILEPEEKKDCVGEKLMKSSDDPSEMQEEAPKSKPEELAEAKLDIKKECTPPPEPTTPTSSTAATTTTTSSSSSSSSSLVGSRRSGRRGGPVVVYSELPQPKRTRGSQGSKVPIKKEDDCEHEQDLKEREKSEDEEKLDREPIKKEAPKKAKTTSVVEKRKPESPEKIENDAKKKTVKEEPKKESPKESAAKEPSTTTPTTSDTPTTPASRGGRAVRKKREVDTTNIIETADAETPVRQSRRIAQQKIREEAERRKLEEIALRSMKEELKKKKKAEKQADPTVLEPSEHSSSEEEEESEVETKKKAKKKCPGKDGAWSSGSEEQEEPEEEDEEPPHYDTDPGSPLFKSDHEFSPESELEDESQVVPMKRARTARKEDAVGGDDGDEEACQKCGKSDHPEWILLCDTCDKGYHCSCLSPVLFYIPEGDWYCPPCQQEQLIAALEQQLKEFDELVERKRLDDEEEKRLAEEAERAEQERLEQEMLKKEQKKHKNKRRGGGSRIYAEGSESSEDDEGNRKSDNDGGSDEDDDDDDKSVVLSKKATNNKGCDKGKRRRGDGRSRRRAAARGTRRRRRNRSGSESGSRSDSSGKDSESGSSSSSATDSDDEPIYKLRKRRQINVSYRLNEYDDLINSALKKEMDELAGAGNLGRGKDITTIIEADKEEKARQKHHNDDDEPEEENSGGEAKDKRSTVPAKATVQKSKTANESPEEEKREEPDEDDDEEDHIGRRMNSKGSLKKKPRKLTTLDISSEEDNASDEDFKTSSFDDEDEDEDTSVSVSTNSDSSLEIYRRRNKHGKKNRRKTSRRAARERRKDRRFVVEESDDEEEEQRPKTKKKRKDDSDYSESESGDDDDLSELSENMDSADLCDDTTSDDSDGAWCPSKRKKQRKSNAPIARKSPKLKKPLVKKPKRVEYSDDDISESEEEEEEDDDGDDAAGGKGSGKQPRSQPLKTSAAVNKTGKGKGKGKTNTPAAKKKKKKPSDEEDSFTDSDDSARKTRGRRYAYLEDFDEESSDGGIKPGVKRPDTPPEERQKFIERQEEIKRMLAEKNAEGAKLAATPRLTPIKGAGEKDKRSPAKPGDSLSTVPLSVIRQAKVLDIDYLQRKGEPVGELDNVDDVDSEFDDADLPDDFPEDMDEDTIARMVEEDDEFVATAAARELPAPDEVMRPQTKTKSKEADKTLTNPSLAALSQMPGATSSSGLQEPVRKRLPMPTMHPPLLRQQFPSSHPGMAPAHLLQRHPPSVGPPPPPPTHLLQSALSAPLVNRTFTTPPQPGPLQRIAGIAQAHLASHILPVRQPLPATHPLPGQAPHGPDAAVGESDAKPRGRRKKITPLRDPLQKQQTAAAVTAATSTHTTNTPEKAEGPPAPTATSVAASVPVPVPAPATTTATPSQSSVIKTVSSTAAPPLAVAQPPQLYKPPGSGAAEPQQPSVITRMPHISSAVRPSSGAPPPSAIYGAPDVAVFYGPPQHGSRASSIVPPRHRGPHSLQMSVLPPHPVMRPTYGPPPPLRGTQSPGNLRSPYAPTTQSDHHPSALSTVYGAPPPARHSSPHLSPYRPTIYGNPNFVPRVAPPGLRPGAHPPGSDYPGGARYPPYGYYPPPPPLTAPHQQTPPTLSTATTHSTGAPSSVIVSAPHAASTATIPTASTNHSVSTITRASPAKSPSPNAPYNSKLAEPRKKLITLETYPIDATKSPLTNFAGESSGSRSSPGVQPDGGEDSSSVPANLAISAGTTGTGGDEGQASEFSGLVSYFSSQHDDYNT